MHLGRKEREDLSHIHHFPLFLLQNHFVMQPREQVFLSSSVWIIQVQKPLKLNHVVEKMNQIFNFLIILKGITKITWTFKRQNSLSQRYESNLALRSLKVEIYPQGCMIGGSILLLFNFRKMWEESTMHSSPYTTPFNSSLLYLTSQRRRH